MADRRTSAAPRRPLPHPPSTSHSGSSSSTGARPGTGSTSTTGGTGGSGRTSNPANGAGAGAGVGSPPLSCLERATSVGSVSSVTSTSSLEAAPFRFAPLGNVRAAYAARPPASPPQRTHPDHHQPLPATEEEEPPPPTRPALVSGDTLDSVIPAQSQSPPPPSTPAPVRVLFDSPAPGIRHPDQLAPPGPQPHVHSTPSDSLAPPTPQAASSPRRVERSPARPIPGAGAPLPDTPQQTPSPYGASQGSITSVRTARPVPLMATSPAYGAGGGVYGTSPRTATPSEHHHHHHHHHSSRLPKQTAHDWQFRNAPGLSTRPSMAALLGKGDRRSREMGTRDVESFLRSRRGSKSSSPVGTSVTPPSASQTPLARTTRYSTQTLQTPYARSISPAPSDIGTPTSHPERVPQPPSSPTPGATRGPTIVKPIPEAAVAYARLPDEETLDDDTKQDNPRGFNDWDTYSVRADYWRSRLTPAEFVKWSVLNPAPPEPLSSPTSSPTSTPKRSAAAHAQTSPKRHSPLAPRSVHSPSSPSTFHPAATVRSYRTSHASSQTVVPHQLSHLTPRASEVPTEESDDVPDASSGTSRRVVDEQGVPLESGGGVLTAEDFAGLGLRFLPQGSGTVRAAALPPVRPPPPHLRRSGEGQPSTATAQAAAEAAAMSICNTADDPQRPNFSRSPTTDSTATVLSGQSIRRLHEARSLAEALESQGESSATSSPDIQSSSLIARRAVAPLAVNSNKQLDANDPCRSYAVSRTPTTSVPFPSRTQPDSPSPASPAPLAPDSQPSSLPKSSGAPGLATATGGSQRVNVAPPASAVPATSAGVDVSQQATPQALQAQRRVARTANDFSFGDLLGEGSYSSVLMAWDELSGPSASITRPESAGDGDTSLLASLGDANPNRRVTAAEAIAGVPAASLVGARASAQGKIAYAVKVLDKVHIMREKKTRYVTVEKDALSRCVRLKGVVTLYWTFHDRTSLYFVTELAPNGDLQSHVRRLGSISLEMTRYWAAQIAQTLAAIHQVGIVHRDLKPENILLDSQNRIRLADFGSAHVTPRDAAGRPVPAYTPHGDQRAGTAHSFVGTAEFVSPELLDAKQTTLASDWWAYGAILYALLAGEPPFRGPSEYTTFQKILKDPVTFPSAFPPNARAFVMAFLQRDPSERLTERCWSTLVHHPFFRTDRDPSDSSHSPALGCLATQDELHPGFETDPSADVPEVWKGLWTRVAPPLKVGIVVRPETPEGERNENVFAMFDTESELAPTEDSRQSNSIYSHSHSHSHSNSYSRSHSHSHSHSQSAASNSLPPNSIRRESAETGEGAPPPQPRPPRQESLPLAPVIPPTAPLRRESSLSPKQAATGSVQLPSPIQRDSSASSGRASGPPRADQRTGSNVSPVGKSARGGESGNEVDDADNEDEGSSLAPSADQSLGWLGHDASVEQPRGRTPAVKSSVQPTIAAVNTQVPLLRSLESSASSSPASIVQSEPSANASAQLAQVADRSSPSSKGRERLKSNKLRQKAKRQLSRALHGAHTDEAEVRAGNGDPNSIVPSPAADSGTARLPFGPSVPGPRDTNDQVHSSAASYASSPITAPSKVEQDAVPPTAGVTPAPVQAKSIAAVPGPQVSPQSPSPSRLFFRRSSLRSIPLAQPCAPPTPPVESRGDSGTTRPATNPDSSASTTVSDSAWHLRPGENIMLAAPVLQRKSGAAYLLPKRRDLILTDYGRLVVVKPPLGEGICKNELVLTDWALPGGSIFPSQLRPLTRAADTLSGPGSSSTTDLGPDLEMVTSMEARGSKAFVLTTTSKRQVHFEDLSGDSTYWLRALRRVMASPAPSIQPAQEPEAPSRSSSSESSNVAPHPDLPPISSTQPSFLPGSALASATIPTSTD